MVLGIQDGKKEPVFPKEYGVKERDVIYKTFRYKSNSLDVHKRLFCT